jgi:hypothetical protein
MGKPLKFKKLLASVRQALDRVPEHRGGQNLQYSLTEAGLSAFAVFYMQSPSFLAHQRDMQRQRGQHNVQSLFGVARIPSDSQLRNLLDPVDPAGLRTPFWEIYAQLEAAGHLDGYSGVGGTRLISLDGSQYFSSEKVKCPNCRVTMREEAPHYAHGVLLAVVSAPEQEAVICLAPEFIRPQDGHEKQDCEQQAIKRWVKRNAARFAPGSVTILTDDLHCHYPLCTLLAQHRMHFILTCKEASHPALYEEVHLLEQVAGAISTQVVEKWHGRRRERWIYRWVAQVPLRGDLETVMVNWCELTICDGATDQQVYHCAWATDHPVTAETVPEIAAGGRSRWKVENEGFNVLKNQGYHFEHNYGHGQQHLSSVLLTLLLLAFLCHTVLGLSCATYQAVRRELGARRTFFNDLRALTRYFYFSDWQCLLTFMYQQLDLPPEGLPNQCEADALTLPHAS